MSETFLSRIKIDNFRTFGAFDICIPPAPGLTLLTGTNGLGKSSFFDAIEWGLTGKVRRFERYLTKELRESKYLTRRNAPPDSHKVSLCFTGGHGVERSTLLHPSMVDVANMLKTDSWAPIRDIGTYLAFTHFLGQAAQQRFTSRESPEQWEALKGPTGIERLEEIRKGLRGRATQLAFTRRIEQEKGTVDNVERQLADWQGWRNRLKRLQQAISATGTLSPGELAEKIASVERELTTIANDRHLVPERVNLSERLIILDDVIFRTRQKLADGLTLLDSRSAIPERYVSLVADARMDGPAVVHARETVDAARRALATAETQSKIAAGAANAEGEIVVNLQTEIELLEAARIDLERRTQLVPAIISARKEETELRDRFAAQQAKLTLAENAIAGERDARSSTVEQRTAAAAARRILEDCQALDGLERTSVATASASTGAVERASEAQPQLLSLTQAQTEIHEQLERAELALELARSRAGEIAAAVARISTHLNDGDTQCPLCNTAFEPGQLRIVVESAATWMDSQLAARDAEVARLRSETVSVDAQITALQDVVRSAGDAQRAADRDQQAVAEARFAVANLLQVVANQDIQGIAVDRDRRTRAQLADAEAALQKAVVLAAGASTQYSTLLIEIEDLRQRLAEAAGRTTAFETEQRSCSERLAARNQAGVHLAGIAAQLGTCQANLENARGRYGALSAAVEQANVSLAAIRAEVVVAERSLIRAEEARRAAQASAEALTVQWSAAGLDLPPSQGSIEAARSAAISKLGRIDDLALRQKQIGRDNEASLLQQEINEIRTSMSEAGGETALVDAAAYESILKTALKAAREAHGTSTSARSAVNNFTDTLKKEAADFSTQFLVPLNRVIDDFNEAMLSTPSETIRFNAEHRVDATRFEMMLHYRDRIENATFETDLPPQLVLSEGQLAANGFSILCAASTAYPWSRWRALLLDDPLQHNDIIHTAAFVDVMRNLVDQKRYQLIMSSHDRAETDFITRKFEAAGLPCSVVTLTAPSAQGVQFEDPVENRAATSARRNEMNKE